MLVSELKADDKISYVDIDYILTNTIAGKLLLENFNKKEKLKVEKFKTSDEDFKNKKKKILAKVTTNLFLYYDKSCALALIRNYKN